MKNKFPWAIIVVFLFMLLLNGAWLYYFAFKTDRVFSKNAIEEPKYKELQEKIYFLKKEYEFLERRNKELRDESLKLRQKN